MSFQLFFHFYDENEYDNLTDETWVKDTLRRMVELIDFAGTETDAKVFYDEKNVFQFADLIEYLFPPPRLASPSGIFRSALKPAYQWRPGKMQDVSASYFQWYFDSTQTLPESDNSLSELTERSISSSGDKFAILSPCVPKSLGRNYLALFKDKAHKPDLPQLNKFELISDTKSLLNFFKSNRTPRVFNLNPKHGENGVGNYQGASPLLCNRTEASELLFNAIGKSGTNELYNFDSAKNRYIVFKFDNTPQNSYHGYHVDDANEVPHSVRTLLSHSALISNA